MLKKSIIAIVCFFCLICSSCSLSMEELKNNVSYLQEENKQLSLEINDFEKVDQLFDFYHTLTLKTVHSLVLVESKNIVTQHIQYSEGVVVYSNGYTYYILTDYTQLIHSNNARYRVMDASANIYEARLIYNGNNVVYDSQTGLALISVQISKSGGRMEPISLGDKTDNMAVISSIGQLNKIKLIDNSYISSEEIINYENITYKTFSINELNYGSIINDNGYLAGLYSYNLQAFVDSSLIKKVAYATYSLIL